MTEIKKIEYELSRLALAQSESERTIYEDTIRRMILDLCKERADLQTRLKSTEISLKSAHETINHQAERLLASLDRRDKLQNALRHIREMAEEDLRTGKGEGTSLYQIEANIRAALGDVNV